VSIALIRDGLETNLRTLAGLRAYAEIPDNPSFPAAIVTLNSIDYDQSFQRGLTLYNFTVSVIVGRASERAAQNSLNAYASNTGASSIKSAVESDKTLSGSAYDVRVVSMTGIGAVELNGTTYIGMDFSVTVYAN
jgi:hypothetical protein